MFWYQKLLERMKTIKNIKGLQALREERGAIFVLTALLLPVLFGFIGIGYDVGNLYMHKAHLQNIADAAALAGARGYVNSLKGSNKVNATDKKVYLAQAGDDLTASKAVHDTAKAKLKTDANQYIEKNNPWYSIGEGSADYKYGKTGGTNSVEYFRVSLTERARVYFLPVIGIDGITDVVASTAVKLTDVERIGVPTGENTPTEAEHKPVVIAGNMFFDNKQTVVRIEDAVSNKEKLEKALEHNSYNASNVYIARGGNTYQMKREVHSTITYSEDANGNEVGSRITDISDLQTVQIQEIDYDMDAFGEEIRELFRKKQESIYNADPAKKSLLEECKREKANYKKGVEEHAAAYTAWLSSGTPTYSSPTSWAEMQEICVKLEEYKNLFVPHDNNEKYEIVLQRWKDDGKPLVATEEDFEELMKRSGYQYYYEQPNENNWQLFVGGNSYKNPFNKGNNGNGLGILKINGQKAPLLSTYTSKYTTFDHEPDLYKDYGLDEYYMTYRGTKGAIHNTSWTNSNNEKYISTLEISTDPSKHDSHLLSNEHSYFYISKETLSEQESAEGNFHILVDGFYVGEDTYDVPYQDANGNWLTRQVTRKYTEDTPFYLFIEDDINQEIHLEFAADCNRPLIFCYMGTAKVHSGNATGRSIKGILYMPNNDSDSHANWDHVTFSGSVVAKNWHFQNGYNDFRYNPTVVNKWKESEYEYVDENGETKKVKSDGLPVTPNYGFSDSSSSGSSSAGGEVTTDKITLPVDHLRIVLPGETRDASHYKESEVTWENL